MIFGSSTFVICLFQLVTIAAMFWQNHFRPPPTAPSCSFDVRSLLARCFHLLPRCALYCGLTYFLSPDKMPCKSILYCEDNDWRWVFANGKDTSQGASRPENGYFSGQKVSLYFNHAQYLRKCCFSVPNT